MSPTLIRIIILIIITFDISSKSDIRVYRNGRIRLSVSFTYTQGNSGAIVYNSNIYSSGSDITLSGTSAAFTVTHTSGTKNGNVQITRVKVVYE